MKTNTHAIFSFNHRFLGWITGTNGVWHTNHVELSSEHELARFIANCELSGSKVIAFDDLTELHWDMITQQATEYLDKVGA